MNRSEALEVIGKHVKNKNLIKHMIATEAVMEALASKFGGEPERWALAGLLHDIDYDTTADDPSKHSKVGYAMLKEMGIDEDIAYAVQVHNDYHDLPRNTKMDSALHIVDPLTGLIVASALIHPAKRLDAIDAEFVYKRFHEKGFAKGAKREQMQKCEVELEMDLIELISIGLLAMQSRSAELGM